ncbi:MAG: ATP-binding cassette domain-containing protein, partial [Verrucomicrobia bacterium]|nr:ATP-binding cassette domain-containing protein [Verrucomicrobiota bacterium]
MTAAQPTLIEVRDAAFGYRGRVVLDGVNLTVARGDFLAVLGPNGGGKTTLLRGLLGTLQPVRGEVRLADGGRLHFGYVPQRESLDPIWPVTALEVTLMGAYGRAAGRLGLPLGRSESA